MKSKHSYSKRIVGHANTGKEKLLAPNMNKEWILGKPLH